MQKWYKRARNQTLLKALVATGKPVVLVLFTGRPLVLNWEQANVPAILNVWFGGSEAAYAIGDVLFGRVNPSGKLTMSFPQNVGQIPLYYAHKNTGRPLHDGKWFEKFRSNYLDVTNSLHIHTGLAQTDIAVCKSGIREPETKWIKRFVRYQYRSIPRRRSCTALHP